MRTSRKTLLIESAFAGAAVLALSAFFWPETLGLQSGGLHIAWIAIIALAARYGAAGLFIALPAVWLPLAGVSYLSTGGEWLLWERTTERTDMIPLVIAIAVAWVTISHQNRHTRIAELLNDAEDENRHTREWGSALEKSLDYLRSRCDRIDTSVRFWRRMAECLERGELQQAASAALEMSMNRTGANAGCIELRDAIPEVIVRAGKWATRDLGDDLTVKAALESRTAARAHQLSEATELDCDLAVPIIDSTDGIVLGVIALRGVDPARVRAAEVSDITIIGDWLSPALARQLRGPRLRSVSTESSR